MTVSSRAPRVSKAQVLEAACRLDLPGLRRLLAHKPELARIVDRRGWNLLQVVASSRCLDLDAPASRAVAIADLLIAHGVDVESGLTTSEGHYVNSVWFAIRGENATLVEHLIRRGARPCGLFSAGWQENLHILGALLDAGADLEEVVDGETPFLHCWKNSKFRSAKFLIGRGANPNAQDRKGRTALHCALERGYEPRLLSMLVRSGASVDVIDAAGNSPRLIASRKRDRRYANALAQPGGRGKMAKSRGL